MLAAECKVPAHEHVCLHRCGGGGGGGGGGGIYLLLLLLLLLLLFLFFGRRGSWTCVDSITDGLMHGSGRVGGVIAWQRVCCRWGCLKAHGRHARQMVCHDVVNAADQAGYRSHACEVQNLRPGIA